ncbi:hypothetical protein Dda_3190 [Drechslerella dactyloides]|uniref:Uncharacterized protein n=1 Tax=Drechslerella dactyloides TaxID=74499 RepID=A0AAD6J249_DREDA|nr:hypothetical protein Dda_3190 [Drechslerella dactyloides]
MANGQAATLSKALTKTLTSLDPPTTYRTKLSVSQLAQTRAAADQLLLSLLSLPVYPILVLVLMQQHSIPPGGIIPGTATGVNPYPNNKPNINLNSYLNNTPTTTSNFAPPPNFATQATANAPYVPHGVGAGQQWNAAGAAQPSVQGHYGQAGVPGFSSNVSSSAFGAPAGYQQQPAGGGFNTQGGSGVAPSAFNAGAYGSQPPPQQQQPGTGFYPGQNSGGTAFGATYAGTVTGPQYSQPQDPNRPGFGQYHSPPPVNAHQPPGAYGQPSGVGIVQPTYGQPGYAGSGFPPSNQAPTAGQAPYGAASQGFNAGFTGQPQPQPPAQPQHQAWQAGYSGPNPSDPVQSISQQWAQNNQQAQSHAVDQGHNKRYSIANVTEPYHSAYATATPPPPAAPKPERPATSATFFAATAGALKTPAPTALSPPTTHSQPHAVPNQGAKPATSSGFASGGIGDWEHYGDFDGDDDDADGASNLPKHETAAEVPGDDTQAVEMAAGTPPQLKQPFPIAQQPQQPQGVHSPPRVHGQGPPVNVQPANFENNQQTAGLWGAERPQSGGQNHVGLQFQNLAHQNIPPVGQGPPQNPALQSLQQPLRTTSPSHGGQPGIGFNVGPAPYQQPQPQPQPPVNVGSPLQNIGSNAYNDGFSRPQPVQLGEQLQKNQEEQIRQQQEQQQQMQAHIQAQLQQQQHLQQQIQQQQIQQQQIQQQQAQQQIQQQQGYPPQVQSPHQQGHPFGQQPQSPPTQSHQQPQPGPYQYPGQSPPGGLGQTQSVPPQQAGFASPPAANPDPYGQPVYGHQRQPSLSGAVQQPQAEMYGQVPVQQQPQTQHQQLLVAGVGIVSTADGIQSPTANQYGQPVAEQPRPQSLDGSTVIQTPAVTIADQLFSHASPVQKFEGAPKPAQPTVSESPNPAATGLETIEIPVDLDSYYKESIRKFIRMIVREASAKSSVESLRIFTEFMEDESYSRGDRYSDASLNDYISDSAKSYSFTGRLRPYTTDSPDPYDVSRRTSGLAGDANGGRDNTFDSIDDSPLTHAIEALKLSGRKGAPSPSVEHRLPFAIDEKEATVPPLNPQHQPLATHTDSPPVTQRRSTKNGTLPFAAPEEPIEPVTHRNTWGDRAELHQPTVAEHTPLVQPLNVKRQSTFVASPPSQNSQRASTTSPAPDSALPNEAHLAQQAALLAKQWHDSRGPGAHSNRNSMVIDTVQEHQAPSPQPNQYPIVVDPSQQPPLQHRQSMPVGPLHPSQSPAHHQGPYPQPSASPGQPRDPYQQPGHPHGPHQPHLMHPASFPANYHELPRQSSPRQGTPRQDTPKQSTPRPGTSRFAQPESPPRSELMGHMEDIPQPLQKSGPAKPPASDPTDASLDQGYVLVTPEPEAPTNPPPVVVDLSSPITVPSISRDPLAARPKSKVDITVLSTILGKDRNGLPDKSSLLVPIREAFEKVGKDFSEIDKMRKEFEVEAKKTRDKNENERDRLKSEHDEYTEELYSQQKILYEDLHDIDEQFNATQNALKEKQEKEEFDKFNSQIFTPVYNLIQERIVELKKQHKALLTVIKTASSGREKFEPSVQKPNLQDSLLLLLDLHDILEAHYMKLQEAIADRDKRFKSTVLTPLYASNNYAKLRDAKKYFDEEEKKAVVKGATDAHDRAKALKAVIDESMIPGLDLEFGFFDEVEQVAAKVIEGLPENPSEYTGDAKLLHDELEYARKILEILTQTQESMFKLYHQVNTSVGQAEKAIAVAQAKQKGEKAEAIKKLEEDKDALSTTLDDELKERLEDVNGHYAEAKGKLEPVLEKYKPAAET